MIEEWEALIAEPPPTDAPTLARYRNVRRAAAQTIADMAERLPRITLPITQCFDWERCRVNVAHLVAPKLVRWTK